MPQKNPKPQEIVVKCRQVDVLVSRGQSVAAAVRSIGVMQFTHYRWRQDCGGLPGGWLLLPAPLGSWPMADTSF